MVRGVGYHSWGYDDRISVVYTKGFYLNILYRFDVSSDYIQRAYNFDNKPVFQMDLDRLFSNLNKTVRLIKCLRFVMFEYIHGCTLEDI